ncbi:MAG: manganese efflux pump [Deltaproteobacteria bacterium]|nr:manganese efflux pump [Deltaproteobacteria bacterium]MDQ3299294.1 manganese efflux pump MntP family protein [Myxococcota bacterium]
MLAALVLALGLAMDASAVAAARGLLGRRRELVILPLLFGGFQAGMAALGWLLGAWGGSYVAAWDHWVAFGLLVVIGGKMLVDALRGDDHPAPDRPAGLGLYLLLAIATSIDAAAAGITLPMLAAPPWFSLLAIGIVTAACSALGYLAARHVGARLGSRLEVLGGLILIGLGVRVLVEHL